MRQENSFGAGGEVGFTFLHFYIKQADRYGVTCFHAASDGFCFGSLIHDGIHNILWGGEDWV